MNATLSHSTIHPPHTEDHQVLQIPAPEELRRLAFIDRVSLRVGIWLLQRAQRPKRAARPAARDRHDYNHVIASTGSIFVSDRHLTAAQAVTVLQYQLHSQQLR